MPFGEDFEKLFARAPTIGTPLHSYAPRLTAVMQQLRQEQPILPNESEAERYAFGYNFDLTQSGLLKSGVYVRSADPKTGLIKEDYGSLEGIGQYRVESEFDGGALVTEQGWGLAFNVRTAKAQNTNQIAAHILQVPIDHPDYHIESADDRHETHAQDFKHHLRHTEDLPGKVGVVALELIETVGSPSNTKRVKKIGRQVAKLVNHQCMRDSPKLMTDLELLIKNGFGPRRFTILSSLSYALFENPNDLLNPSLYKSNNRSSFVTDGVLQGVAILRSPNSRKKVSPYFVMEPTVKKAAVRLIPLEYIQDMQPR